MRERHHPFDARVPDFGFFPSGEDGARAQVSYAFDDFSTFKPTSPDDFTHLGAAGEGVVALKQSDGAQCETSPTYGNPPPRAHPPRPNARARTRAQARANAYARTCVHTRSHTAHRATRCTLTHTLLSHDKSQKPALLSCSPPQVQHFDAVLPVPAARRCPRRAQRLDPGSLLFSLLASAFVRSFRPDEDRNRLIVPQT